MLQIICAGTSTSLHEFPNLKTLSIIDENNGISAKNLGCDLQIFGTKKLFVRRNAKSSDLSYIRVNKTGSLEKLQTFGAKELSAFACPKQNQYEIAIGMPTGEVKIIHCKTFAVQTRFPSDRNVRNPVIFMDYNSTGENLASAYESGKINIFGLKTRIKVHSIQSDDNNLVAINRFHPSRQTHLAIGCYSGKVQYYDVGSKRILYENSKAQTEIINDIGMSTARPDILMSAGYDKAVNMFDLRKKDVVLQLDVSHPVKSFSISDCGDFCCTGDFNGVINCYDFRFPTKVLNTMSMQAAGVPIRVAFVPNRVERASMVSSGLYRLSELRADPANTAIEEEKVSTISTTHENFMSEINYFHSNRFPEFSPTSRLSQSSRLSTQSNLSMDFADRRRVLDMLDSSEEGNHKLEATNSLEEKENFETPKNHDVYVNLSRLKKRQKHPITRQSTVYTAPLQEIDEETTQNMITTPALLPKNDPIDENKKIAEAIAAQSTTAVKVEEDEIENFYNLPSNQNSTPNTVSTPGGRGGKHLGSNMLREIDDRLTRFEETIVSRLDGRLQAKVEKTLDDLKKEMKMHEQSLMFETIAAAIRSDYQNHQRFNTLEEVVRDVHGGVGMLCQSENFVAEFDHLQQENAKLRSEVEQLRRQLFEMGRK